MNTIKIVLLILITASLKAQVKYSINIGGIANEVPAGYGEFGYLASLNLDYNLVEKHGIEGEIQFQQTYYTTWVIRFDQITSPGPWEIRTDWAVDKTKRAIGNLVYVYQPYKFLRFGIGVTGGVRLAQDVRTMGFTRELLANSIMSSQFIYGAILKTRFNIKSIYIEFRYIHTINKSRAVYRLNDGVKYLEEIRTRPVQLVFGYVFNRKK